MRVAGMIKSLRNVVRLSCLLWLCSLTCVSISRARADALTHFRGVPVVSAGAPARAVYCEGASDGSQARYGADFVNDGEVALKVVRIRFDFYDAFGALLHSESADYTGTYGKGVRISGAGNNGWTVGARYFPNLANASSVRCAIERTLDVRGDMWTNTMLPSPAPSVQP